MNDILLGIITIVGLVAGITLHEFSHALSADLLGDPTPSAQGRLTLNPIAHFDPIGALMILFSAFSSFGFGWGKPVQVSPLYFRFGPRVGMAITAIAGPFANLVLATLCAAPIRIMMALGISISYEVWLILIVIISVNIGLALFNMLPIPPLDGFSVLRGGVSLIPTRWGYQLGYWLDRFEPYGSVVFLLVVFGGRLLPGGSLVGLVLGPLHRLLLSLILGMG